MVTSTAVPYVYRIKESIISISMKWFRFRAIKTCEKKLIIHFLLMIVFIQFFSHTGSLRTREIYESHWFIPHSDFICQLFSQRTIKNNRFFSAHKNTYWIFWILSLTNSRNIQFWMKHWKICWTKTIMTYFIANSGEFWIIKIISL